MVGWGELFGVVDKFTSLFRRSPIDQTKMASNRSRLLELPRSAADARMFFDSWSKTYSADSELGLQCTVKQMAAMLKAAGFHAGSRVLDVGCGTGLSGAAMRAAGIGASGGIIGIDISDESLDEAFARAKCYQDTKLHNMEEAWPFADATFDAVVAVGTSSCVENSTTFTLKCAALPSRVH